MLFASSARELWQTRLGYEIGHAKFSMRWWKLFLWVYLCLCVYVCVCRLVHLCAGLPKRAIILQALTQSTEILSLELISSSHADWQSQHKAWKKVLSYRICLLRKKKQSHHADCIPNKFNQSIFRNFNLWSFNYTTKAQACNLKNPGNSLHNEFLNDQLNFVPLPKLQSTNFVFLLLDR